MSMTAYTLLVPKQMLPQAILMPRIFSLALGMEKSSWTQTDSTVNTAKETTNSNLRMSKRRSRAAG